MRHSCCNCEGWSTRQPSHSMSIASPRTYRTWRAVAWTNCSWVLMVEWGSPLCAAAYIDPKRFQNVWMTHQWWCNTCLDLHQPHSIFRLWENPMTPHASQMSHRRPFWFSDESYAANIWKTFAYRLSHHHTTPLVCCALSWHNSPWSHFIIKAIEIGF